MAAYLHSTAGGRQGKACRRQTQLPKTHTGWFSKLVQDNDEVACQTEDYEGQPVVPVKFDTDSMNKFGTCGIWCFLGTCISTGYQNCLLFMILVTRAIKC